MKKMSVIILLLCVILFSACQSTNVYKEDAVQEVPIGFFDELTFSSYITVQIGDQTFDALFDTGDYTTGITLSPETINELGLEKTGDTTNLMSADAIRENIVEYTIPQMKIGDTVVENVLCREEDMQSYREMTWVSDLNALMGLQAFQAKHNILISYKQGKMYIYDKNTTQSFLADWVKLPMTDDNNLFVDGTIDGETYTFCVDNQTGSYNGELFEMAFENHSAFADSPFATISYELDGKTFESNFEYVEVPYADQIPIDFFLGIAFYAEHDVYIDFDEKTVYVKG